MGEVINVLSAKLASVAETNPSAKATLLIADNLGEAINSLFLALQTPNYHHSKTMRAAADELKALALRLDDMERELAVQTGLAIGRNVVIGTLSEENERLKQELRDHMWWERTATDLQSQRDQLHAKLQSGPASSFQVRVADWMDACFGPEIAADRTERNHRFLEEGLELVQAGGCTKSEALQLVDYVYGRPVGEMRQEIGGVMVTLAALCRAFGFDMHGCAEEEVARIWIRMPQIRAKQATKPKHSPLPEMPTTLRSTPSAWMRGVSSYVPGEPTEYDVEVVPDCDGPPEDGHKWIPLYRRAEDAA